MALNTCLHGSLGSWDHHLVGGGSQYWYFYSQGTYAQSIADDTCTLGQPKMFFYDENMKDCFNNLLENVGIQQDFERFVFIVFIIEVRE
jgi:hypothetical protein